MWKEEAREKGLQTPEVGCGFAVCYWATTAGLLAAVPSTVCLVGSTMAPPISQATLVPAVFIDAIPAASVSVSAVAPAIGPTSGNQVATVN